MKKLDRLKHKLPMSRFTLDEASFDQAKLAYSIQEYSEDCSAEYEEYKLDVAEEKAIQEIKIRKLKPAKLLLMYGLSDLKESTVKALIGKNSKILRMERKLIEKKRLMGKAKHLVNSVQARASMIKRLTDLYVAGYWSKTTQEGTPKTKRRYRDD